MTPTIYINLEDDVASIAARIQRQRAGQVVLVCPKRCFLFNDPINLKLLKTQIDLFGKEVFILTMDERGREYAEAAGFGLRQVPGAPRMSSVSDIKRSTDKPAVPKEQPEPAGSRHAPAGAVLYRTVQGAAAGLTNFAKSLSSAQPEADKAESAQPAGAPVLSDQAVRIPPVVSSPGSEMPQDIRVKDAIFPSELGQNLRMEQKTRHNKRMAAALLGGALCLLMAVIFVILPKAEVVVYPRTEPITRDMEITLTGDVKQPDVDRLAIPAYKAAETLEASDTFQSQGKKQVGNKADGTVKIYNFTKAPINLKSATTVLTVNGKNYTLVPGLVQVKPTRYTNAVSKEIDPSSLGDSVEISAVQGGEQSNLPAGTRIEITNQVFGSKPQFLYAKTDTPITGGVSRYVSVIGDQDITAAQNALKQKLVAQVQSEMQQKGLRLLENAYTLEVSAFSTDKPANSESPNFTARLNLKLVGVAFSASGLDNLITARVRQSIADNRVLETDPNVPNSYVIKTVDVNAGAAVIAAHFQGKAVSIVDVKNLPAQLVGKTSAEVNNILTAKPEIDRIDVTLAPSWQKSFPWFAQKIMVRVGD